jgi:hypothetical protein
VDRKYEVGAVYVGVEIDNGGVTHESEAQAFSPECICIVDGDAGWD